MMMRPALFAFAATLAISAPAFAQDHSAHGEHGAPQGQAPDPHAGHHMPEAAPADPHAGHQMPQQDPDMTGDFDPMFGGPTGLFGSYPMNRDASGTSWQPDAASHGGVHTMAGDWMIMSHALLNGVYDWQDGPRGDEKAFVSGMIMSSARREIGIDGTLALRAMLAPDPFMGKDGYPLLFAAGETADGVEPLVDRQHPHDLFMELAASYSHRLGMYDSVFLYAGLPGEPAFGPPAFMHRPAAVDSPEAPITHHWFDSTHITFGVVTAGWVHEDWKIEASRFRGREPDEQRYNIESGELDSTSVRASWNPTQELALQVSWADVTSPEALEPDEDEERFSASGLYTKQLGGDASWSATLAFARKERSDGVTLDAWLGEAAYMPNDKWTLFARAEAIETDELGEEHHGPVEQVTRLSAGAIRDWRLSENVKLGLGALVQRHQTSNALEPLYHGDPAGAMAFVRLKVE